MLTLFKKKQIYQLDFYISFAFIFFLFGIFNNLCSFLTFIRSKPRKFGVGTYFLLLLKIIRVILKSSGISFWHDTLNIFSYKIISYLLPVFTRINYWLSSRFTIERLRSMLFPTEATFTKTKNCFRFKFLNYTDRICNAYSCSIISYIHY